MIPKILASVEREITHPSLLDNTTTGLLIIDGLITESGALDQIDLTLEVEDWDRAIAALDFHGIRTFGERSNVGAESLWHEAFIHPKETGGVLLQIFWQAKPGLWE